MISLSRSSPRPLVAWKDLTCFSHLTRACWRNLTGLFFQLLDGGLPLFIDWMWIEEMHTQIEGIFFIFFWISIQWRVPFRWVTKTWGMDSTQDGSMQGSWWGPPRVSHDQSKPVVLCPLPLTISSICHRSLGFYTNQNVLDRRIKIK